MPGSVHPFIERCQNSPGALGIPGPGSSSEKNGGPACEEAEGRQQDNPEGPWAAMSPMRVVDWRPPKWRAGRTASPLSRGWPRPAFPAPQAGRAGGRSSPPLESLQRAAVTRRAPGVAPRRASPPPLRGTAARSRRGGGYKGGPAARRPPLRSPGRSA